ncbi:MAG TPA: hypothetical protein DGT21_15310 [Armatimonadetes bacterium]|nr:hypothetical protein [Armatimonadota bacterium]
MRPALYSTRAPSHSKIARSGTTTLPSIVRGNTSKASTRALGSTGWADDGAIPVSISVSTAKAGSSNRICLNSRESTL